MPNILSAKQFKKEDIDEILMRSQKMEEQCASGKVEKILQDKIIACIFFEPSTRTRLSFESAAIRLGAGIISSENAAANSSAFKGETIEDTTRILCSYADVIVVRHSKVGEVEAASKVSTRPIINAGDGGNEHPTQALLDLYTIKKHMGRLDNLNVAFGFDPKHSRTIRSLALLLSHFKNNHFTFFYANRLQEERFEDKKEFEKYRKILVITRDLVQDSKTLILDPLPRIDEIETEVDYFPNALYFDQAQNGLYVRMAVLLYVLGL